MDSTTLSQTNRPDSRVDRRQFLKDSAAAITLLANATELWGAGFSSGTLLPLDDTAFLREQTRRIVNSARLAPGETRGKWRNETQYSLHSPSGDLGYPAFWIRDAVMMLDIDLISLKEIEGWIRFIAKAAQGAKESVQGDRYIPPFTIPDHIRFDGTPEYFPGKYPERAQKRPPLDNNFYFISGVHSHWKTSNSIQFFQSPVDTTEGAVKLCDFCEQAYRAVSSDPETGLVLIGDINKVNAKDWGFCDMIYKSGKLLFPSLLKFVAARQLSEMFRVAHKSDKGSMYEQDSVKIQQSIRSTFFNRTLKNEGWLHSATGACNQPDVWGTAFAVLTGAADESIARDLARALLRAYRMNTGVEQGCVRPTLTTDSTNSGGWDKAYCPLGEYQNGGYWGTPTGWYVAAIARVNRAAASEMAREYIKYLKKEMRSDGTTMAWEWFNPSPNRPKATHPAKALYVATVGLPYSTMLSSGLIPRENTSHAD